MTDSDYIRWGESLYSSGGKGDTDTRCYSNAIVKTKTEHRCMASREAHLIPPRSRAFREKALVDGRWGTSYTCLPCIEAWKNECDPFEGAEK